MIAMDIDEFRDALESPRMKFEFDRIIAEERYIANREGYSLGVKDGITHPGSAASLDEGIDIESEPEASKPTTPEFKVGFNVQ